MSPTYGKCAVNVDLTARVVEGQTGNSKFLMENYKFEENEIHFLLGYSIVIFYTTKSHGKGESSSFDLTHFPGIPFNSKRDLFPLRRRGRLSFSPRWPVCQQLSVFTSGLGCGVPVCGRPQSDWPVSGPLNWAVGG